MMVLLPATLLLRLWPHRDAVHSIATLFVVVTLAERCSCAAENGHEAIVKLLVEREDIEPDSKDNLGRTRAVLGGKDGHEAVVRLLVGRDDVDEPSPRGAKVSQTITNQNETCRLEHGHR